MLLSRMANYMVAPQTAKRSNWKQGFVANMTIRKALSFALSLLLALLIADTFLAAFSSMPVWHCIKPVRVVNYPRAER